MAGSEGQRSIRVVVAALEQLSDELTQQVAHAEGVAEHTKRKAQVTTRVAELQTVLEGLNRTWQELLDRACQEGRHLAYGVDFAAELYNENEHGLARLLQPESSASADATPAPGSMSGYIRWLVGENDGPIASTQRHLDSDLDQLLHPGGSSGGGEEVSGDSPLGYIEALSGDAGGSTGERLSGNGGSGREGMS